MARYTCEELRLPAGETVLRLADAAAGLDAAIVPELGAVWWDFGVRNSAGRRVELFHPAGHFSNPGGSPVLFPVTGRSLCDGALGSYRHHGTVYEMPIHGFARDLPWSVEGTGTDQGSAWVTCSLSDTAETRVVYPYPFRVALTYRLREGAMAIEAVVENPGADPLPFHLGYHPHFRMPVFPEGDRGGCLMEVPTESTWELANLCATGNRLPMAAGEAFFPGRPLGQETMDRVFADVKPDPATGLARCWARDPEAGTTIAVEYDPRQFPVFVVYTSPADPYVCLEPWTGLPGGLGDDTVSGRTARRVPPGGRFEGTVTVTVTIDS